MPTARERLDELRAIKSQQTSPARARLEELRLKAQQAQQPERSTMEQIQGGAEVAKTLVGGIVAEPLSGLAGLAATASDTLGITEGTPETRAAFVEDVSKRIMSNFMPESEVGQEQLQVVAETLQPVVDALQTVEQKSAEAGYQAGGESPLAGALASAIPTLAIELAGLGGIRKGKQVAKATRDIEKLKTIQAAKEVDVPVLTTDLFEPDTRIGKLAQEASESLGAFGTGGARVNQQAARQNAVRGLADELEIELDSDFASNIVNSLKTKNKKVLREAGEQRAKAVESLNTYGEVAPKQITKTLDELEASQSALRESANPTITKLINDYRQTFSKPSTFEEMQNFRTQVIRARNAFDRAEDTSPRDAAQAIKSAIDKDMMSFARTKDRVAAKDWLASNRKFAEELDITKRTELKRILNSGETTPEQVINILARGRQSELRRLNNALTPAGKVNAQKALIQKALTDSKYFNPDLEPNPNAFLTAINKPNFQKAKNVFFEGESQKRLDGLNRALAATRRAQEASTTVRTGEKLLLPAAIGGSIANPLAGVSATLATSVISKAYESRAFRNALVKLSGTKPQSRQELEALEGVYTMLAAELQAAKAQQEREAEKESE